MSTKYHGILVSEIEDDPLGLGYKNSDDSWKSDSAILALLTAVSFEARQLISAEAVRNWMAINGSLASLYDTAHVTLTAEEIKAGVRKSQKAPARGVAIALWQIFQEPGRMFDLDDPDTYAMFTMLRAQNILTPPQFSRLLEKVTTMKSRADVLGLASLQQPHIATARELAGQ